MAQGRGMVSGLQGLSSVEERGQHKASCHPVSPYSNRSGGTPHPGCLLSLGEKRRRKGAQWETEAESRQPV
jgi:hypothetical protein